MSCKIIFTKIFKGFQQLTIFPKKINLESFNWVLNAPFCKLIKKSIFRRCFQNTKIISTFLNCCQMFPNEIGTSLREIFRIQSKYMVEVFLQKYLTVFSHSLFSRKSLSQMFDMVQNTLLSLSTLLTDKDASYV